MQVYKYAFVVCWFVNHVTVHAQSSRIIDVVLIVTEISGCKCPPMCIGVKESVARLAVAAGLQCIAAELETYCRPRTLNNTSEVEVYYLNDGTPFGPITTVASNTYLAVE